ncbi:DNA-binding protein Alba [Candidatus Woesearchaeota archaeon]|nr:DNA-binding protein Alba [Candidatus Woesearchaeota archaeon]
MEDSTEEKEKDNIIFVGEKNFMNYVTAIVLQFTSLGAEEVIVKARGKFIAKAVDISEVAMKRFLESQVKTDKVLINSEEFTNKEGRQIRVSTIEIYIKK